MSHKKHSTFGIFATSGAVGDATDALVKQGFPAADITSSTESPAPEAGASILLTVQGNTAVEMEVAREIIERHGASDAASAGEAVITTRKMDRQAASDRIL